MDIQEQKTILLVEDDVLISMATTLTIKGFGYKVISAYSGEEAVETALSSEQIDLILIDLGLGKGIDGTEAARQILGEKIIPIVFLTSHPEQEYVDKVKEITRYGYLLKNSGDFVLRSSIEMAFELFEANRQMAEEILQRAYAEKLLQQRTEALSTFNRAMIGREQRIIEMKEEVNALCRELGLEPKYPPVWRKGSES